MTVALEILTPVQAGELLQLPARTMVSCHRHTERRLREILAGKKLPNDVEIINL